MPVSGASHSFVTKSMAKLHKWLVDSTKPMSFSLAKGSSFAFDQMYYKGSYDLTGLLLACTYGTQHWDAMQHTHNDTCSRKVHDMG